MNKPVAQEQQEVETVDIRKKSSELKHYSEGSLEALNKTHAIRSHWFKEKVIVFLSVTVILLILFFSFVAIVFPPDDSSADWGRQTLSALLGFAAGSIWQTKVMKDS